MTSERSDSQPISDLEPPKTGTKCNRGPRWRRWPRSLTDRIGSVLTVSGGAPAVSAVATLAIVGSISPTFPEPGLDPSWRIGVAIGATRGWEFGTDILFTSGPLGFLENTLAEFRGQFVLGVAFGLVSLALLWAALYLSLRRLTTSAPAAIGAGFLTVAIGGFPFGDRLIAAFGGFAVLWLGSRKCNVRGTCWLVAAISVAAALQVLVKFSEGVILVALAGIVAVFAVPTRSAVKTLGTALGVVIPTTVVLWLVAGQSLTTLPRYVVASQSLVAGYPDSMAYEQQTFALSYLLAVVIVAAVLVFAWRAGRDVSTRARWGIVASVVVILTFGFKQGFTRHDGHDQLFFALAAVLLIVVANRRTRVVAWTLAAVAAVCAGAGLEKFDPLPARDNWADAVQVAVDSSYHRTLQAEAVAEARAQYALSPAILDAIGDRPVSLDPWEATLPWAYGMNWRPVPMFQNYSAYTEYLDALNAEALLSAPKDQVVLRSSGPGLDGRNPLWETPRYMLALVCDYRATLADKTWQVLSHATDRCGAPTRVDTRTVEAGQAVTVPRAAAGDLLVARFVPDALRGVDALAAIVFKPLKPLTITADGDQFRVPRGLSDGPLLMKLPVAAMWPEHFGGDTDYRRLVFSEPGRVMFEAVHIE